MAERSSNDQPTQEDLDNRSRQLDQEHSTYWKDRGYVDRPSDWKERSERSTGKGRK